MTHLTHNQHRQRAPLQWLESLPSFLVTRNPKSREANLLSALRHLAEGEERPKVALVRVAFLPPMVQICSPIKFSFHFFWEMITGTENTLQSAILLWQTYTSLYSRLVITKYLRMKNLDSLKSKSRIVWIPQFGSYCRWSMILLKSG
jgi:hypothetical protein